MPPLPALGVTLHGIPVGTIQPRGEGTAFGLSDEYLRTPNRPVLGQAFEDSPNREHRSAQGVPKWFANLLPEGALRSLIAKQAGVHESRSSFLLERLGQDLPGAVVVTSLGDVDGDGETGGEAPTEMRGMDELKFSLAGVQLKFSALADQQKLTIPAHGLGGDWIVKLPDRKYSLVPENEYAMMQLAAAAGIDVPPSRLVLVREIAGLPDGLADPALNAFAIERFDRTPAGERVHIEDFAQVLDLWPTEKYGHANYETLLRITLATAGVESALEMVRRLVFNVLIGNGDAHVKNWSFIYPDGVMARLSPAYDMVSTVAYMPNESLALNMAKTKAFGEVTLATFRSLAERTGLDPDQVSATVREQVARTIVAWRELPAELPLAAFQIDAVDRHLDRLPLSRGV